MHLSCGNCKALQSFSGDPPKCDVCGWVSETEPTATSAKRRASERTFFARLGWLVFGVVVVLGATLWLRPEKERLAREYDVSQDQVFVEPKPHGCDYDDAPLGNKHCHFERVVDTAKHCVGSNCRVTAVYESWKKVEE